MATVEEIIGLILKAELSIEDRVAIVRAVRNTIPDLVAPSPRLKARIDTAQGVRPEYVDFTMTGLANSELWQQSASTTPKQIRFHRNTAAEYRLLFEEAQAFADILKHNFRYQYFLAVDLSRTAHRVGKELTGEVAVLVKPHLEIMADARPSNGRRRVKPTTQPTTIVPPSVKE